MRERGLFVVTGLTVLTDWSVSYYTPDSSGNRETEAPMSVAQQSIAGQITYDDLYRRWEEGNWKATELDFSEDRKGWDSLNDIQRKSALWIYSMFFYGEAGGPAALPPYIEAARKEEQKSFWATQQVDEARHAVFF